MKTQIKLILALFFLAASNARGQESNKYHIVFDLDETLIYSVPETQIKENPHQVLKWVYEAGPGEMRTRYFRLSDGATELLQFLVLKKEVKVSFYSAGMSDRNRAVLKQILLPDGRSASDIAHKILSADDLVLDAEELELKKDLNKHFGSLDNVLIVDDSRDYIKKSEALNHLVVDVKIGSAQESYGDLYKAGALLEKTIAEARASNGNFVDAYQVVLKANSNMSVLEQSGKNLLKSTNSCLNRAVLGIL